MWKQRLKEVVAPFLETEEKTIDCIVSPDIDGIVSALILNQYAKKFGKEIKIIGLYNSKQLYSPFDLEQCKRAIWLDLDCRFEKVAHIGQHLLGNVSINREAFNPNIHFEIFNIFEKYPFSTSHLLLFGLFDSSTDAFSVFQEKFSLAGSVLAHCDSTYKNCMVYPQNCKDWCDRLFQNNIPRHFSLLLRGEYHEKAFKVHSHACQLMSDFLYSGNQKKEGWPKWNGMQNVKSYDLIEPLMKQLGKIFRCETPECFLEEMKIVVAGKLERWDANQVENLNNNPSIISHAILSRRYLSVTVV